MLDEHPQVAERLKKLAERHRERLYTKKTK
jgi:hypothetical protein